MKLLIIRLRIQAIHTAAPAGKCVMLIFPAAQFNMNARRTARVVIISKRTLIWRRLAAVAVLTNARPMRLITPKQTVAFAQVAKPLLLAI
jgi:hypothetical protein